MALKAGIIGLPNVGKSTLFNAITKKNILAANYPFATIDPNIGVVTVPDKRLETLNEMYIPERLIPTQYEFIDIAGLVKGASTGEGLGNKFLANIREVDAIVQVVRCFENKDIIHVEGNIDPVRDIEIVNYELILSDLEIVEGRLSRIEKKAVTSNDKEALYEVALLKKLKEILSSGKMLRLETFDEKENKWVLNGTKETEGLVSTVGKVYDSIFDDDVGLDHRVANIEDVLYDSVNEEGDTVQGLISIVGNLQNPEGSYVLQSVYRSEVGSISSLNFTDENSTTIVDEINSINSRLK